MRAVLCHSLDIIPDEVQLQIKQSGLKMNAVPHSTMNANGGREN